MLSPYWLRTVEVGFWQFDWDGVDVWMLLGDFQLCRDKRADPDMSELMQNLKKNTTRHPDSTWTSRGSKCFFSSLQLCSLKKENFTFVHLLK